MAMAAAGGCFCCPASSAFRFFFFHHHHHHQAPPAPPVASSPIPGVVAPLGWCRGSGGGRGGRARRLRVLAGGCSADGDFGRDGAGLAAVAGRGLVAVALSSVLQFSPAVQLASADEFGVLGAGPPLESHVVDDAGVLNRVTKSDLKRLLAEVEDRRGYHIDMVTLRKLTTKSDVFEFADQVLERWYPTVEEGDKKGLVLLVTTQKEGAVTGGPAFINAVGDKVLESIVSDNLPVLATEEKYNEALFSTAKRLVAALDELPDPGGPKFQENKRESNFKTREETDEKRGQFTTVVVGLLVIAFVVPMAQYYAYVSRK